MKGPDRNERAASLRAVLQDESPQTVAFLDEMKDAFGAKVLWVKTDSIEQGKEPEPGIKPYTHLPDSTWPYGVGKSPATVVTKPTAVKKVRR